MIEQLFAQQGQPQAFLAMLLGGLALGGAAQLNAAICRRWPRLSVPADVLLALGLLAVLVFPAMALDTPLRLYGLLGLTLGAAVYAAGIAPLAAAVGRKIFPHPQEKP